MTPVLLALLAAPSARAKPATLQIQVVDDAGSIVPTATVVAPQEGERHHVNTETGSYSTGVLFLPDGSEVNLQRDTALDLVVSAPGYASVNLTTLPHKRGKAIVVALPTKLTLPTLDCVSEITPALGTDHAGFLVASAAALAEEQGAEVTTCLHQARAWSAYSELIRAAAAHAAEPTLESEAAINTAREQSISLIAAWQEVAEANSLEASGAAALCLSTSGGVLSASCTP